MSRRRRSVEVEPARSDVETLTEALGTTIDPELLVLALTHRSFAHEAGGIPTNERLEFLGDSVLGLVVTEHLYRNHPDEPEGDLARMRAATVSQKALASVARKIGLGDYILLGRGELVTGGRDKDSILSDTVEALIGATYLCHGLEHTRGVVSALVGPLLARAADLGAGLDWKTSLQELAAERGLGAPTYVVTGEGPDHARTFTAAVVLDGGEHGRGTGTSKKIAEQNAAEDAYAALAADGAGTDGAGSDGQAETAAD
ncbi:ribonuclease III [Georgenia alba]|uniref:Ribonuclease 3 n=1 Tax=Georgenia alba TaxID=2233858 RepID=A0ABW2Q7W4_9MICO